VGGREHAVTGRRVWSTLFVLPGYDDDMGSLTSDSALTNRLASLYARFNWRSCRSNIAQEARKVDK